MRKTPLAHHAPNKRHISHSHARGIRHPPLRKPSLRDLAVIIAARARARLGIRAAMVVAGEDTVLVSALDLWTRPVVVVVLLDARALQLRTAVVLVLVLSRLWRGWVGHIGRCLAWVR